MKQVKILNKLVKDGSIQSYFYEDKWDIDVGNYQELTIFFHNNKHITITSNMNTGRDNTNLLIQ